MAQYPNIIKLMQDKQIKLYLPCKTAAGIVELKLYMTLNGNWCVVNRQYGQGYYGMFDPKNNWELKLHRSCNFPDELLETLNAVETKGLDALNDFGLLTGICCVCGRLLVAEESINSGIGPICAGRVGWSLGRPSQDKPTAEDF